MTNDAKTITNTASESVTTQIGDGSAVQSVMNESGITNNATDKTVATNAKDILNTATGNITNSAANGTITNTAKDLVNTATGNMTNTVGGELKTTVTGKVTEDYKSDLDTKVGGNQTTTVTGDSSLTAESITNEAKNKITNKAIDVETDASSSIVSKVSNEYGSNTSTQLSYQTKEEMSQVDGKTASYLRGAAEEKSQLTDGDKKTTIDTIADQTNTTVVNQDAMSLASSITDGTKANNTNSTVDKSEQLIKASDTQYSATTKTEDALVNGSTLIDIVKDSTTGMVSSAVTDGNTSTGISQSAKDISLSAAGGTIANAAQNITNTASESITNTVGKTTVTTTDSGTTFENTDHNTAIKEGTVTKTTISGNTIETGQATMDYADVMKDLGVHGNATVDQKLTVKGDSDLQGNANVGKNLTVNGTSDLKGDVTMESNATVEKDLTVEGTTKTEKLVVNNGATVTGGTTTDTLHVTSTSTFDGQATFKDIVTMEKDLSVGGNATVAGSMTASSYKVGDKTYIDSNGINANDQKVVNVAPGRIAADSTDAVNGSQLYQTNERVTGVENKVNKLDSRVDKVGANAAALANLHPLEFDADSKWNIAAAVGGYKGETATAIGAFYRPNENVMVNVSSSFGTGENMYGGGISLRIGQGGNKARRNATNGLTEREKAQQKQIDYLTSRLDALLSVINPNMSKDFPDVPENHWAYEAVSKLAGNGIIQGYEDGKYHGERTMTRYEMAEIIYNALSKGAKAEKKLVEEFKPEIQAMAAQKKA
ncbi:S-layer homology domain-containing protein [Megasphaera sp.]|uniref:S-layer homology domain-containing protein n=1 Tax=Megasphaera sp. TaxID=2023260 RepID=UPI004027FFC9